MSLFCMGILMRKCCRLWTSTSNYHWHSCHVRIHFGVWRSTGGALHYTAIWNTESAQCWGMSSEDALWSIKGKTWDISVRRSGTIRLLFHPCSFQSQLLSEVKSVCCGEEICIASKHRPIHLKLWFGLPLRRSWWIPLGQRSWGRRGRGRGWQEWKQQADKGGRLIVIMSSFF